jgi:hypothetical protein
MDINKFKEMLEEFANALFLRMSEEYGDNNVDIMVSNAPKHVDNVFNPDIISAKVTVSVCGKGTDNYVVSLTHDGEVTYTTLYGG